MEKHEYGVGEYRAELAQLRKRIARLKDDLERAYERETTLVSTIADMEDEARRTYTVELPNGSVRRFR